MCMLHVSHYDDQRNFCVIICKHLFLSLCVSLIFILACFFTMRPVVNCSIIPPTSLLTLSHINLTLLSEYLVLHSCSPLDSLFDSLHCICIDLNLGLNGYTSVCKTSVLYSQHESFCFIVNSKYGTIKSQPNKELKAKRTTTTQVSQVCSVYRNGLISMMQ
jgi:hypothetical protein